MRPQDKIKNEVARAHGMIVGDMLSKEKRSPRYVRARRELYFRLQQELGWSLQEIGDYVKRDHTTVLHALNTLKKLSPGVRDVIVSTMRVNAVIDSMKQPR